jgi:hypothetical protein
VWTAGWFLKSGGSLLENNRDEGVCWIPGRRIWVLCPGLDYALITETAIGWIIYGSDLIERGQIHTLRSGINRHGCINRIVTLWSNRDRPYQNLRFIALSLQLFPIFLPRPRSGGARTGTTAPWLWFPPQTSQSPKPQIERRYTKLWCLRA